MSPFWRPETLPPNLADHLRERIAILCENGVEPAFAEVFATRDLLRYAGRGQPSRTETLSAETGLTPLPL